MSDDYIVFHSVARQVRDTRGGVKDGETDFLIINPTLNILIIEVKGGAIKYNGKTGEWFSGQYAIKDPRDQGRRAKYSLLKKIQEIPEWKNTWINIGWSLSFPDVKIPRQPLFLDVPHELVLDSLSMQNSINDWVVNAFSYLDHNLDQNILRKESIVDYRKINSLIQVLAPSWEFQIDVSSDIEKQENIIKRLTDEQFVVLDFLSRHRRVAISGCAGSGKTLVALEKANRLSQEGFNVLLLCNNPNLANFLCKKIDDNRIHVKDFFAWINNILDKKEFEIINFEWSEFLELPQKYLEDV